MPIIYWLFLIYLFQIRISKSCNTCSKRFYAIVSINDTQHSNSENWNTKKKRDYFFIISFSVLNNFLGLKVHNFCFCFICKFVSSYIERKEKSQFNWRIFKELWNRDFLRYIVIYIPIYCFQIWSEFIRSFWEDNTATEYIWFCIIYMYDKMEIKRDWKIILSSLNQRCAFPLIFDIAIVYTL